MDWKPEKDTDSGKIVCEYGLSTAVLLVYLIHFFPSARTYMSVEILVVCRMSFEIVAINQMSVKILPVCQIGPNPLVGCVP